METMEQYNHFKVKQDGSIFIVTLANPEKRNIFSAETWEEMRMIIALISNREDIRVVLINAEGTCFSAGIEFQTLLQADSHMVRKALYKNQNTFYGWEELDIPVIVAIQGYCLGNAAEMILFADLRIASKDAVFAYPEVQVAGLAPDMGGLAKLHHLVGIGQAKRLILTGEYIDGQEAKNIGLVEYLVENEELQEKAMCVARAIAASPEAGIYMAKKGLNMAPESSKLAIRSFELAQSIYCCGTEDSKEGLSAMIEKRKPEFKGK